MQIDRFYIREGVKGFPITKQQEMQAEAGCADLPTYHDTVRKRGPNRKKPSFAERDRMLKPTSRDSDEIIGVAGIRCLADSLLDLAAVMAACELRQASIYCLDTENFYNPTTMRPSDSAKLSADFDGAAKRQQTDEGRKTAHKARSKKAKAKRDPIIEFVEPLWAQPTDKMTTAQIIAEAEKHFKRPISMSFLNKWMGPRHVALEKAAKGKKPL